VWSPGESGGGGPHTHQRSLSHTLTTSHILLTHPSPLLSPRAQLFGYSRTELEGQSVEVLIPERVRQQHVAYRQAYARDPSQRAMGHGRELFGRRKDGSEFTVEVGLNPLVGPSGPLVMTSVVDISSRREREVAEARLREERDHLLRVTVEASPSGVVVVRADDSGTIVLVNATLENVRGAPAAAAAERVTGAVSRAGWTLSLPPSLQRLARSLQTF
jgi:PAS domain S-box-containing protein